MIVGGDTKKSFFTGQQWFGICKVGTRAMSFYLVSGGWFEFKLRESQQYLCKIIIIFSLVSNGLVLFCLWWLSCFKSVNECSHKKYHIQIYTV